MELHPIAVAVRWIHVASACLLTGSVFFFNVVLPRGMRDMDAASYELMVRRCQRGFKMTVHVTLLLFLLSGAYNAVKNWPIYTQNPGVMHGLFGLHVLLGLGGVTVLMIVLARRDVIKPERGSIRWALVSLLVAIVAASSLKSAREYQMTHPHPIANLPSGGIK